MKYLILCLFLFFSLDVAAQIPAKSIKWINSEGEVYIKELTENSSINWELDNYGTLKITNYSPHEKASGKEIVRKYTFFNLSEFNPVKIVDDRLLFQCLEKKFKCIKSRNYFGRSKFNASETTTYYFVLAGEKRKDKTKKIVVILNRVIKGLRQNS